METSGLVKGTKALNDAEKSANKTADAADKVGKSSARAGEGFSSFGNVIKGLGLGLFIQQSIRLSDEYTKFTAQLKLATQSTAEYSKASAEVQRIAKITEGGLSSTGVLYARITNATRDLGVTQSQVAKVTETVGLSLKVAGAGAAESSSAMLQLSQAFGAGALRGEEFNAISESAPGLLAILAKSMGVTRGELKKMAEQGLLTSAALTNAFTNEVVLDNLRKQAEEVRTISGSFTVLRDKLVLFAGEADKASGASKGLASLLSGLADAVEFAGKTIKEHQVMFASIGAVLGAAAVAAGLYATAAAIGAISGAVIALGMALLANPVTLTLLGIGAVAAAGVGAYSAYKKTAEGIEQTNEALLKQRAIIEKNLASGRLDIDQKAANIATLEKVNKAIKDNNAQLGAMSVAGLDNRAEDARLSRMTAQKLAAGQKPAASKKPGSHGAAKDPFAEAQRYLESLQRQLDKTLELSVEETTLAEIQSGRMGKVNPALEKQLLNTSRLIDLQRAEQDNLKASEEAAKDAAASAGKLFSEAERFAQSVETPFEKLQRQLEELERTVDANPLIGAETASRVGTKYWQEYLRSLESVNKEINRFDEFSKKAAENIQDSIGDGLFDLMQGNFKNIGNSFKQMLDRMVAEALAADIARKMFGGLVQGGSGGGWLGTLAGAALGAFGGTGDQAAVASSMGGNSMDNMMTLTKGFGTASAKGNVFNSPGLSAYSGQIVSKPTLFPFAKGTGLMGEAGPEAIMPLKRGADGKLGVSGGGGQQMVVNNNFNLSGPVNHDTKQQIAAMAADSIRRAQRNR